MMRAEPHGRVKCADDLAKAAVDGFDRFDHGGDHAGVPDHIAVGKVHDDESIATAFDGLDNGRTYGVCAHFWLKIVGRDFG